MSALSPIETSGDAVINGTEKEEAASSIAKVLVCNFMGKIVEFRDEYKISAIKLTKSSIK